MGLKLLPELDSIYVYEKGEVDDWGISSTTTSKKEFRCLIREAESSTAIESKGGRMVVPSYSISFNGDVPIHVGDMLEVEGRKMVVLTRNSKKDLSGKVLIIKLTV